MGKREIVITKSAAESIAGVSWFIESKGLVATAENFVDSIYSFIDELATDSRRIALCREPERALLGYKCIPFKKKYTIVLVETDESITIKEFVASKLIKW